jgi:hypothetical protein
MGWLKGNGKPLETEIAEKILSQDGFISLHEIFAELPATLGEWFINARKAAMSGESYTEVDITDSLSVATGELPGDIVVRKSRDPRVGDKVRMYTRSEEGYSVQTVVVKKINLKDNTLFVQDLLDEDVQGSVSVANIVYVIDKVIPYNSVEWKKVVQTLDIPVDLDAVLQSAKATEEYLKENKEFYERDKQLKRVAERIAQLKHK